MTRIGRFSGGRQLASPDHRVGQDCVLRHCAIASQLAELKGGGTVHVGISVCRLVGR
jgi:hypothetical protein